MDELDQECQELRDNLADAEDGRDDAISELKETQKEIKNLKEELHAERVSVYLPDLKKSFVDNGSKSRNQTNFNPVWGFVCNTDQFIKSDYKISPLSRIRANDF